MDGWLWTVHTSESAMRCDAVQSHAMSAQWGGDSRVGVTVCAVYVMAALSVLSQRVDPRAELRASMSPGVQFPALMSSVASGICGRPVWQRMQCMHACQQRAKVFPGSLRLLHSIELVAKMSCTVVFGHWNFAPVPQICMDGDAFRH